jgi:hypothetical protein
MSPKQRKLLEDKRQQLHLEQLASIAKANQATGAIAMIDSMLAMSDEDPAPPPAEANGAHLNA